MGRFARVAILALLLLVGAAAPASTSPLDISTEHFRYVPDEGSRGLASRLSELGEAKRSYVLGLLGARDDRVIEVRIASSEEDMARMVGTERPVREWIAGLAFPDQGRIVLSARGNEVFNATDTFVHELAHMYLDSSLGDRAAPRWFHEGFAMLVAGEEVGERLKTFLGAAATGSFLPLSELEDGFPSEVPRVHLAYAQSQMFVHYLQRTGGGSGVRQLMDALKAGMPFALAFDQTFGGSPDDLWRAFARTIDPFSSWLVFATSAAVLWMLIVALFLWAYRRKRRKAMARKAMWTMQEEIERLRAAVPDEQDPLRAVPGPEEVQ